MAHISAFFRRRQKSEKLPLSQKESILTISMLSTALCYQVSIYAIYASLEVITKHIQSLLRKLFIGDL